MNNHSIIYLKCIIGLAFVAILIGCNTGSEKAKARVIDTPAFKEISIESIDSIMLNTKSLHLWYWKLIGDKVIAQHPDQDRALYIYSLPNFNLINSYGIIGHGPGEFIVVNWGQTLDDNDVLIYDMMKKELYDLELVGDSLKSRNVYPLPTFDSDDDYKNLAKPFTMIQKLAGDIFLMKVDDMQTTTLEVMDLKKSRILSILPIEFKKRAELGYPPFDFNISVSKQQVVLGYWNMNRIEFYDINKDYQLIPKLVIGNSEDQSNIPEEDWKYYYVDMDIEGQYVYLVNNVDINADKGSYIDIYTLEGLPVNRIILNEQITHILVDSSNNEFYGYSPLESGSVVFKYDLNEVNRH